MGKPLTPLTPLGPMSEPCSFAMPTPTTSWIQMALNSKKAEKSKVVTCVSGNMLRPMSIGSDLSDAGSDISMEKMQILQNVDVLILLILNRCYPFTDYRYIYLS